MPVISALFSAFFRWLGLCRVRALKRFGFQEEAEIPIFTAPLQSSSVLVLESGGLLVESAEAFSNGGTEREMLTLVHCHYHCGEVVNGETLHAPNSASARAPRQGTDVLEPREKRQRKRSMLEVSWHSAT
jgi:hypothetical protein